MIELEQYFYKHLDVSVEIDVENKRIKAFPDSNNLINMATITDTFWEDAQKIADNFNIENIVSYDFYIDSKNIIISIDVYNTPINIFLDTPIIRNLNILSGGLVSIKNSQHTVIKEWFYYHFDTISNLYKYKFSKVNGLSISTKEDIDFDKVDMEYNHLIINIKDSEQDSIIENYSISLSNIKCSAPKIVVFNYEKIEITILNSDIKSISVEGYRNYNPVIKLNCPLSLKQIKYVDCIFDPIFILENSGVSYVNYCDYILNNINGTGIFYLDVEKTWQQNYINFIIKKIIKNDIKVYSLKSKLDITDYFLLEDGLEKDFEYKCIGIKING